MRQITIADINERIRGLRNINPSGNSRILIESAQLIINSKRIRDIKRFIESSIRMDTEVPFYVYAELFDMVATYGTCAEICNIGNYIAENAIPKVRDSKATNILLKGRLTRLQHKLNSPVMDSISDVIGKLQSPISSVPKSNDTEKEQVATEAYNQMIDKCTIMAHCDRVIENYNKVSKRFNLDKLFLENTRINGIEDTVVELCNMIDTYSMPSTIKFNTVIETAWYGFESNSIPYNKSSILETAIDYFLFKKDGLNSCKQILESTLFYDKNEDMDNVNIFEPEEGTGSDYVVDKAVDTVINSVVGAFNHTPVTESSDFNNLFEKFKKEELPKTDKPENKLKGLIDKLYRKDVNSIVDETPDLLKWVRRFFIIGSCTIPTIGPVLTAVGLIADKFISIYKDREELPKMLKCFNAEIKASKTKLQSVDDSEEKNKLEKYIKTLEDARDKISGYYNDRLTEEEQDKRFENMSDEGYEFDDDFGFDFDDDEFFENSVFGGINKSIASIIEVCNSNIINENSMYRLVSYISDDDLLNLAGLANRYPEVFYKEAVIAGINNDILAIQKGKITFPSILEKSIRSSTLTNALSIIESENKYDNVITIFEGANELDIINEAYRALIIMIDTYNNQNRLLEASFTNTIKVASMKLRNSITKMRDKERNISRSLDIGMNSFKKSIERALTNDNRESIIKGSILPSFSKIVKMCLINAGLIALQQPVLAVIGTLGYFAVNGKFKAKERQMVVDEIEIELEMCEKYINIAEQKNDMQALRQLLTTKKELERQRQRIKYKMRVDFGQKYYDSKAPNS